ncbi:MAG: stage sporulation protein [Firmicutes bacterium]|nr:stage sporulation protein [Bacillota bacterium]
MSNKVWYGFAAVLMIFVVFGWLFFFRQSHAGAQVVNQQGLIRLHILANSDSTGDQRLKLKVRDAVVTYLTPLLSQMTNPADARKVVFDNQDELLELAKKVIRENGYDYSATIETGWFDFPLRSYGAVVVPAGRYEAVRILLGAAEGRNWWCVLFPPLCFVDGTSGVAVPASASEFQPQGKVEIRWKIAEVFLGVDGR